MGIPVVIRSWVPQVWVRCGIWHTVTYHVPVLQCYGYVTGILPPGEHKFYGFETHFFLNLINFFHPVTLMQPNMVLPATHVYPCLLPSSSTLLPLLSHNKKPSKLYLYILKTHQLFIFRLIIHVLKLSWVFILLVLTIFDADADKQWRVSTDDGGQAQTMAGEYKQLWIRTKLSIYLVGTDYIWCRCR